MKIITNQSPTSLIRLTLLVLAVLFFYLMPGQVFSAGLVPCGGEGEPACQLCHIFRLFDNIVDFILFDIVPPLAVLMVVIGGVMFFAAADNPANINKAKDLLKSVAIGLVIIYSAYILISLFFSVIGVATWDGWSLKGGWFNYPCP